MNFLGFRGKSVKKQKHSQRQASRGRFAAFNRSLPFEMLEQRHLLSVTLGPIHGPEDDSSFQIPSGKNLYVPLTGTDAGATISYAATSDNTNVKVSVLTGNPSLKISVTGTNSSNQAFSGTMTLQLFQNMAPNTVSVIEGLVNSHFYDGKSFYRIVPDFVIQGGYGNGSPAPNFNNEPNVALSFNSPGMLAMANAGPNTNSSEIFITDIGQKLTDTAQFLNYRYTAFGQLTSGFDTYVNVMNAIGIRLPDPNNPNDQGVSTPTIPVTITSVTIFNDTQNGVLQITEPSNFSGTSNIMVTATGSDTTTAQQSFVVNAAPPGAPTNSNPLTLGPVINQTTTKNTPITIPLSANLFESISTNALTFTVTGADFTSAPANVTVSITPGTTNTTATATLTPATGFTGTVNLVAHVIDPAQGGLQDALSFTLSVFAANTVTSPVNAGNVTSTTISGTGQAGTTVSVTAGDGSHSTAAKTGTVGTDGNWSVSGIDVTTLNNGTVTYTAVQNDGQGHTTTSTLTTAKDTVAPTVAISTVTNPINGGNQHSVSLAGTVEVGATVTVVAKDAANHSTSSATAVVNGQGAWTVTGLDVSSLNDGTITFTATATDTTTNTTTTTQTATKDTVVSPFTLATVTSPITAANKTTVSLSGTVETGSTVSVVAKDEANHTTSSASATVDAQGNWTVTGFDVSALEDGTITFTATATDGHGSTATVTQGVPKMTSLVTIVANPVNAANVTHVSVSGTVADPNSSVKVSVTDGTHTLGPFTATVDTQGNWTATGLDLSTLTDGSITFNVTAMDSHEVTSTGTKSVAKDTSAPSILLSTVTSPINSTNSTNVSASGTGEAGATVVVSASDGTHSVTGTATIDTQGNWSVSGMNLSTLSDGTITFLATASDTVGNSGQSLSKTATKDIVAPTITVTTIPTTINATGVSNITVSGTTEVGATLELTVTDGTNSTNTFIPTVDPSGNWSVLGVGVGSLADGTITFKFKSTDAAGNVTNTTKTAIKDTHIPTVLITAVTNPISASNATNTTISGTGEAGATLSIVATDGPHSSTAVQATVGNDGKWSASGINVSTFNDGSITYNVTASDAVGNTAQATSTSVKDTTSTGSLAGFVYINSSSSVVAPTAAQGLKGVILVLNGTDSSNNPFPTRTTTTGADGSYSFTGLSAGKYTITEIQPKDLVSGGGIAGSLGGSVGGSIGGSSASNTVSSNISDITVTSSSAGSNYNFTQTGLKPSFFSIEFFLASTPTPQNLFNTYIASDGMAVPVVMSIVKGQVDPVTGGTTTYTVTFSRNVTGVNAADFTLTPSSGITGASITSVTGSGTTYTVTVNTGSGSGTLGIKLVDNDSIHDSFSTPIGGVGDNGTFFGPVYTVSRSSTIAITSVTNPVNASNASSTAASGTNVAGATVSVVATDGTHTTSPVTATVTGTTWTASGINVSTLNDGTITYTATATATDTSTASASLTSTKNTSSSSSFAITSVTTPINTTNVTSTTASGTVAAGSTVSVVATDGTHTTSPVNATVTGTTWTATGINVSTLNDGSITYQATPKDSQNNTGTPTSLTSTKDTIAPTVAVTTVTTPINGTNMANTTASGTVSAGSSVSVTATDGTHTTTAVTATVSGTTWSVSSINVSSLNDGTITYVATATDSANNVTLSTGFTSTKTTSSATIAVTQVTNPINGSNASNTSANGTVAAGSTVIVTASDGTHTTSPVNATVTGTTWSASGINVAGFNDGTIIYTATATTPSNQTASSSLASTKNTSTNGPIVVILTTTNPVNTSNQATTSASGTVAAGSTVSVVASDGTHTTSPVAATVVGGTWSATNINVSSLNDGTITYTATATDSSNVTGQPASLTTTKDTVPPAVSVLVITSPITSANMATTSASGTYEAGAITITVVATDGVHTTSPVNATLTSGNWSATNIDVSTFNDTTITYTATATDAAGNTLTSSLSSTKSTQAGDQLADAALSGEDSWTD